MTIWLAIAGWAGHLPAAVIAALGSLGTALYQQGTYAVSALAHSLAHIVTAARGLL
jgi:hypothetical protein